MSGNTEPDYRAVEIPTIKTRDEYTAPERRAELLDIISELGHLSMVNQTELAERYGVTQMMISKDLDAIAEHVRGRLGERHELEIESVFRRSIRGLLNEEEYRKAARTAKEYSEWMTDRAEIEELREDIELLKK